ncbi:MAG: preprotein translocase subunit SecA [Chlamydiota bacterium]
MFGLLKKFFGTAQARTLKKYEKLVQKVHFFEESYQLFSEEDLRNKTAEFKKRITEGEPLDNLLPEAYAVVKTMCKRLVGEQIHVSGYDQKWDMIPYDVQILGAIAMHFGSISEMQTGEGKTLTASMPLYLNALTGEPVHLVTVNDYLAKRDCEWIGVIFLRLGLSVGHLSTDMNPQSRAEIYKKDIVYGTASEFGFDYLRDHSMAMNKQEQVQRGQYFVIVDEIDSVLIDEARTPLIISGPAANKRQMYDLLKEGVSHIVKKQRDYCRKLALQAKKDLEKEGIIGENKLRKKTPSIKEAIGRLWLVSKGTPRNPTLKTLKEHPDIRAEIEQLETYYYSEQNKEEKNEALSALYIVVDERASEYELTDKGIDLWTSYNKNASGSQGTSDDFMMLDLGFEYEKIEEEDLSSAEKMQKKLALRKEDALRKERAHNLRQLFRAHLLMEKDVDYIVQNQKIVIIDENTGRPQPGRRFSDGLHQAIEAKEGVKIQGETQTYATITLQNYFRMYKKLAGMTGTAMTEAAEFKELYHLDVLEIPTHKQCVRQDFDDEIYMTEREKYAAIIQEIVSIHEKGQPILIGTESVEVSEKFSQILKKNRLHHTVLNAKNHAKEAEIIASAGIEGAITLATNMAGRGTDIKLTKAACLAGGLYVIGTTRHQSRRIDRQLRGRSGRLGDPGASKFFVSFEDSLMRLFASPRMTSVLQRFRPPEGEPISAKVLNKSIETAQKRVEQRNYGMRKHTLEYDDVMNKQRQEIYAFREEVMHASDPEHIAEEIIAKAITLVCSEFAEETSMQNLLSSLMSHYPVHFSEEELSGENSASKEELIREKVLEEFRKKCAMQMEQMTEFSSPDKDPSSVIQEVIRNLMIRKTDLLWQEHLLGIDHLRSDVHLRAVGQKDPLIEFKEEAFLRFEGLSFELYQEIARDLFRFEMVRPQEQLLQKLLQKEPGKDRPSLEELIETMRSNNDAAGKNGQKRQKNKSSSNPPNKSLR